ncbi:LCP family protein [Nonomuraea typhae]|uniref:LCP family protein n=1 Tax=Nonomuraea typhae TaxID=2603600 RepID=A0ABW7YJZ9_9ACTN
MGVAQSREPARTGEVLAWTLLSAIAPGAGHLRAGWRRTGLVLLGLYAALLLGAFLLYLNADGDLFGAATEYLQTIAAGALLLGAGWFVMIVHTYVAFRPGRLPQGAQILTGTLAGLLAVAMITPFVVVANTAWTTESGLNAIFAPSTPQPQAEQQGRPVDPWAGRKRVNILLLGGDADTHRTGVRTDSMNLASVDVASGNTVLMSLPRNLENVRFRPGTPMAGRFPGGFRLPADPGGGRSDLLNSVWEYADAHPEIFGGKTHQGAKVLMDTIGYTLGVKVDWYALVNMWGFAKLIDAIGGVTITVETDVVFGKFNEGLVKAGTRKLNGGDAMWYARSRTYSDDYTRMRRQRCVIAALLDQADPATVLTRFNKIALATKELLRTDIPRDVLKHLVPLALKVKNGKVTSIQFVPPLIHTGYPDWEKIRQISAKAIRDSVAQRPAVATAGPSAAPTGTAAAPATPKPRKSSDSTKSLGDGCGVL